MSPPVREEALTARVYPDELSEALHVLLPRPDQKPAKSKKELSFGDLIYLKLKLPSQQKKFYLIGSIQNTLECVSKTCKLLDNPKAYFKRCLFRLLNPLSSAEDGRTNHVAYGQQVLFVHNFSGFHLCIRKDVSDN